jgi:hypothetical protein
MDVADDVDVGKQRIGLKNDPQFSVGHGFAGHIRSAIQYRAGILFFQTRNDPQSVVLPQPLGPNTDTNSPCLMPTLMSLKAVNWPNILVMLRTSRKLVTPLILCKLVHFDYAVSPMTGHFGISTAETELSCFEKPYGYRGEACHAEWHRCTNTPAQPEREVPANGWKWFYRMYYLGALLLS